MSKIIAYCKIGCPHSNSTNNLLNNIGSNNDITIIDIKTNDYTDTVETIGGKQFGKSKNDFFKHVADLHHINLDRHRSFPVNIFEQSDGIKYFIGGNDKLQEIYSSAESTSDVSTKNPHSKCIGEFNSFGQDGHKRLYCHFLKILGKISD